MRYGREVGAQEPDQHDASSVADADAVQEQLHELVRRQRLAGEHRMRRRQRERAQQPGRRRSARPRSRSRWAAKMRTSASLSAIGRRVISWKRVPTLDISRQMSMTRCWRITTAATSRSSNASPAGIVGQRGFERRRVERGLDHRGDQLVLVGEDPEDRALGDPGRLGDLPGGDPIAVLEQQRQRGGDDHRPPLVGRQRGGAPRLQGCLADGCRFDGCLGRGHAGHAT